MAVKLYAVHVECFGNLVTYVSPLHDSKQISTYYVEAVLTTILMVALDCRLHVMNVAVV